MLLRHNNVFRGPTIRVRAFSSLAQEGVQCCNKERNQTHCNYTIKSELYIKSLTYPAPQAVYAAFLELHAQMQLHGVINLLPHAHASSLAHS